MFNLYPRPSASSSTRDDGVLDIGVVDDDDVARYRALYGIAVVCVSILLFCVLAATVSVLRAVAFAATAALLLGVLGCSAPGMCVRRRWRGRSSTLIVLTARGGGGGVGGGALPISRVPGRCACSPPVDIIEAPPAFAYVVEDGGDQSSRRCATCSVCLEDVRGGEMVRRLPACTHVFHLECIDMWLRSHRTCPMCRCVVARSTAAAAAKDALPEPPSDEEALPPV